MKLYATHTSERASKSQGGNEFIAGKVTADRNMALIEYHIAPADDDYRIIIRVHGERAREVLIKGKRQKGEVCYEEHTHGKYAGVTPPHAHD